MWTRGGRPGTLAPASDVHPAPIPCRLGTTEVLTGQVLHSACSSPSSFLSKAQLSLQLGGGNEGRGPESRSQAAAWVHCARTEEQGGRRPEPAGLYAPLHAFTVLQWPRPVPDAVLPLPCPPGPLEGALRSHTSFRPCPWAQWPHVHPWTLP